MASTVTYLLFIGLGLAVTLGDVLVEGERSVFMALVPSAPPETQSGTQLTGAAVADTSGLSANGDVMVAVLFLVISFYALYRMRDTRTTLRFAKSLGQFQGYAGFVLRLLLGIVFVWRGFLLDRGFEGGLGAFLGGLLHIIIGLLLIVGLYTRPAAYIGVFLLLKSLFFAEDHLFTLVLLGNLVLLFILGPGLPSFDLERAGGARKHLHHA